MMLMITVDVELNPGPSEGQKKKGWIETKMGIDNKLYAYGTCVHTCTCTRDGEERRKGGRSL